MSASLVTVGRYPAVPRAELVRGHLLAHGIASVLQNCESATLRPDWATTQLFDVQLQVRAADAPEATRLVAEWERVEAARRERGPSDREACLACGAELAPEHRRCAACGWTWETDAPG